MAETVTTTAVVWWNLSYIHVRTVFLSCNEKQPKSSKLKGGGGCHLRIIFSKGIAMFLSLDCKYLSVGTPIGLSTIHMCIRRGGGGVTLHV